MRQSPSSAVLWSTGLVYFAFALAWGAPLGDKPGISREDDKSGPNLEAEGEHATRIVAAARAQVGRTVSYDPADVRLDYPGGDVPIEKGVCTDVVIRALRDALEMDLQKLVHEDMGIAFAKYPKSWGLKRPDPNIDHRRVPNLQCYMKRKGWAVKVTEESRDYLPGDLVTCLLPHNLPHIMIVSDRGAGDGTPLVIHNIGRGAREEDRLFAFAITGHYRIGLDGPTGR